MGARSNRFIAEVDARIRGDIAKFGLHVFGSVMPDRMPFLHTVGLQGHELPELVVTGLPFEQGHPMINAVGKWCMDHGDDLVMPGREWTVPEFHTGLVWKEGGVSRLWCQQYMNKMHRFYPRQWKPGSGGSVIQVLWPDANGVHPGPLWPAEEQLVLADWRS